MPASEIVKGYPFRPLGDRDSLHPSSPKVIGSHTTTHGLECFESRQFVGNDFIRTVGGTNEPIWSAVNARDCVAAARLKRNPECGACELAKPPST